MIHALIFVGALVIVVALSGLLLWLHIASDPVDHRFQAFDPDEGDEGGFG